MKKLTLLFGLLLIISCSDNPIPKPDTLLEEEIMVDILYDTALLQAAEAYMPDKLTDKGVKIKNYIYLKYEIDSTTYYQNQRYYAGDAKKYKRIFQKVIERIDTNKELVDTLLVKETKIDTVKKVIKNRKFMKTPETTE
ncbi:MAG: DUF4296 domain-containing protein [Flavobacterium sp.]|nr:DUF4296 domain-containing protein [Flavobacterium sp.]